MIKYAFTGLITLFITFSNYSKNNLTDVTISYKEDPSHILEINDVVNLDFIQLKDRNKLNFGFTKSNYWMRLDLKKLSPHSSYKIAFNTIIIDSIEVYEQHQKTFKKTLIGEAFLSNDRYLSYAFIPKKEQCTIYFKFIGRDNPLAIPFEVSKTEKLENSESNKLIILGIIYGIVFFILLINLGLFISTFERIYIYCMFFNLFSLGVLFYFDGIFKRYFFPNSLYWNNESIAIAFCGCFIFTNYYIPEFLNLRQHKKKLLHYFSLFNGIFFIILVLSFWHPIGFNWYLKFNIVLTSVEVVLLTYGIFYIRKKEKDYFVIQLISVLCLNVFGTISQLYFLGILPISFLTIYTVHFVILPQIFIQAFALGRRLSLLVKHQALLSISLQESAEEYSRSLINNIEEERKRLSKDFHDSIGQNLLVIRNSMLRMRKDNLETKHREKIIELMHITSETIDEIRVISQNLRPTMLDSIGLTASIESMIRKLNEAVDTNFILDCPQSIDNIVQKDLEINIYRILQELTNNIIKHANAQNAIISIRKENEILFVSTKDDGIGFDANFKDNFNPKNGLSAIKERTNILKGKLNLFTAINHGTTTTVSIPVNNFKH